MDIVATLIGAGLGVSIAPACVAIILVPGVCTIPLISKHRTLVEMVLRDDSGKPSALRLVDYAGKFRT